jgi:hypothetical protein
MLLSDGVAVPSTFDTVIEIEPLFTTGGTIRQAAA